MDPLSVAGSVVGILAAAAQIIPQLYNLGIAIKDAPRVTQAAVLELNDITNILMQLRRYIDGELQASFQRLSLITVESITASLTGCVITYSELDAMLKSLRVGENIRAWNRALWLVKKDSVNALIGRLQNHKSSFSLMLNIIQCSSVAEAERSMDNLCDQVALLLRSNQELSMRLRNLEDAYSVRDGRASAIDASTAAGADSPTHSTDSPRASMSNFNGREENPAPAFTVSNDEVPHHSAFEELLHRSRVYRHAQRRHSQSSLTNDGRSTLAISICSSLTLGEVSNISVYALPLYASEISNAEAYTFGLTVAMTPPGPDDEPPDNVARPRTTDKPEQDVSTSPGKKKLRRWTSFQRRPAERLETPPRTVFGVPLVTSIRYANVGVSLQDEEGGKYIYGYVPIVVAKCGIYLKESGLFVENIFHVSIAPKILRELRAIFDSPTQYGRDFDWTGYLVQDVAGTLLRYVLTLPEPLIPLDCYEEFRAPMTSKLPLESLEDAHQQSLIKQYQRRMADLPEFNRHTLFYLLDLLAVFASVSDRNSMTSDKLAAIFQPGILAHPLHRDFPEEYRLNQLILTFMIEQQDHFLIGSDARQ